jgi:molybdopterin molybdotransferase
MLSVDQAEALILSIVQPFDPACDREQVPLRDARERVLAQVVTSALDFPHWDNSAMDGYAVRFADVESAKAEQPVTLTVIETIPAGYQLQKPVQTGQAARIFTGSVMPDGADTIVIQEETQRQDDQVLICKAPAARAFVRPRAAFYCAGAPLLPLGTQIRAAELAVLAAAQCAQVQVYRRPKVAILSTGNELVAIDQPLQPGQIVDSNAYALAALVAQLGAESICLGIVPDEPEALRTAIAQAVLQADIVLSSGGVSVGEYDYVDEILRTLGANIHIRAVAIKPGKPLTFATLPAQGRPHPTLFFGLPGNPASVMVTFWRFVQPALRKLSGLPEPWSLPVVLATTQQELRSDGKRETYLWGQLHLVEGRYAFQPAGGSQNSGNLINLAGANGLAKLAIGQAQVSVGELVPVVKIG